MTQIEIDNILDRFFISKEDLAQRSVFSEFSHSLSEIIIDDFLKNYLLNNSHLGIYLPHTDGTVLMKKIKKFMNFLLTADVNEEYVQKIYFVGSIHYTAKIEPITVNYGFWALNEILKKIAKVNQVVDENSSLISKLLKFVEYLMLDGYYIQEKKQKSNHKPTQLNVQNELYIGFNIHKLNTQKISNFIQTNDQKIIKDIKEDASACYFGKILNELSQNKKYEFILNFQLQEIIELHERWHDEFKIINAAVNSKDDTKVKIHHKKIEEVTQNLKSVLETTLENSLENGQLALESGMEAMRMMTDLFYEKGPQKQDRENTEKSIKETLENTILKPLIWAIDDVVIRANSDFSATYTVKKQIRYKMQDLFIGIKFKEKQSNFYLSEMINLLLEVFDLHLSAKERENSLIDFAEKAESANKSKDMFLANMSHELRTPLNAITGFSQILMMKKDTPDGVKKYVEKINIAGNNLLDLVNTILDFAKLEAGKMQFKPSLSNISNVLKEVEILIAPMANKKKIELKIPKIISLNLFIDKTLFKQVLINLLSNAVKFSHEGSQVSLNIIYNADKHKYVFEVKDNGVGLSQKEASKLFQAFAQVENTYQKEHKGTGLGLMISKKIIEDLHKGNIWVESEKGVGSSFFLSMPTPMLESHTYSVAKAVKGAKNVLIVEDSEEYQRILIEHLKDLYNLTLTDTVNKAKDLLSNNKYDFIILDYFLTDGISSEVLQFMEEEKISIPAIVISAEDEINISSSLAGSSNLECIVNKKNIQEICASLRGESYS